jgi:hypothetical protein
MKELSKTSFLTNILYYIKLYSGVLLLLTALNLPFIILIIIAYSSIHYVKINKGFARSNLIDFSFEGEVFV